MNFLEYEDEVFKLWNSFWHRKTVLILYIGSSMWSICSNFFVKLVRGFTVTEAVTTERSLTVYVGIISVFIRLLRGTCTTNGNLGSGTLLPLFKVVCNKVVWRLGNPERVLVGTCVVDALMGIRSVVEDRDKVLHLMGTVIILFHLDTVFSFMFIMARGIGVTERWIIFWVVIRGMPTDSSENKSEVIVGYVSNFGYLTTGIACKGKLVENGLASEKR